MAPPLVSLSPPPTSHLAPLQAHWWWLQKEVWEGQALAPLHASRRVTKEGKHAPHVLFLEEDHSCSRDIYVAAKVERGDEGSRWQLYHFPF